MKNLNNCKKIGILGGTFNPVHTGHLLMAEYAREAVGLDVILFIPTGNSYMKQSKEILPGKIRKEILDISIADNDFFLSSDIELNREGNTYTYETLRELSYSYPQAQLFFLTGADCLFSIEKWVRPEEIFKYCTLVVANRNHTSMESMLEKKQFLEEHYGAQILLMDFPTVDISSTEIRNRLRRGKSIKYMVSEAVLNYLQDLDFYKQ